MGKCRYSIRASVPSLVREWDKTFAKDNAIASAITDRLVHRSRTFILTGESRRLHEHQIN